VRAPSLATLLLAPAVLAACEREEAGAQYRVFGGNPEFGRALIADYGCTACHAIPGLGTFAGSVGPALDGFGARAYIAGRLPNRPTMLTAWLLDPPAIDPETAMPALGLTEAEARDIAAYLYTLR
jgi:cytochrome c1